MSTAAPIVITALGLASSLGTSPEATFDAILAGRSGLGPMSALEQVPAPQKGGGQAQELPSTEPENVPRETRYLRYVIEQAIRNAGAHTYDAHQVAAVFGTTLHGMRAGGRWLRSGDLNELRMFPAGAVLREALRGTLVGGIRLSTCSACSSGLSAIALGVTLLCTGQADMVVAGGYDTVSEYAYAGFDSLRLVAAGPPRPFGNGRDGMKTAEGYAVVILERESDARARGARCRGYVSGFGESADAHHLTQPHPDGQGATSAIAQALAKAGLSAEEIDLISAHATATPGNDASEYAALSAAFGSRLRETPVVAFKSQLGHTLGGAGAVELVLTVLARERGLIPPTQKSLPMDPAFTELRPNHGPPMPRRIAATLNLSLGFGGANTCVVVTSARPRELELSGDEPVITGIGVVLPDAVGNDRFAEILTSGPGGGTVRSGPVPEASIEHLLNTRRVRRMSDYVKLTLAATNVARAHAGIGDSPDFAQRACVLLGTMHGSANFCEAYYSQIVRDGLASANPVLFAEGVPNAAAAQLSLMLGVRGSCQTIIGSRTAGLDALRLAALRIREGIWSRVFVGAAEEFCETVNRATMACGYPDDTAFCAGAVSVILESRSAAEARGARILATVETGYSPGGSENRFTGANDTDVANGDFVMMSLAGEKSDLKARRATEFARNAPHWLVNRVVPECFSVGGVAGLAGILLAPQAIAGPNAQPGTRVRVLAADFATRATGVSVRLS